MLTALNRKRAALTARFFVDIKALTAFNWKNSGVNGVFCRFKKVNGV